eukprot:gene7486-9200_t
MYDKESLINQVEENIETPIRDQPRPPTISPSQAFRRKIEDNKVFNAIKKTPVASAIKESKEEVIFLLGWTFPVLISNVLNMVIYLLVNMMFAGRLGKDELAAVALGNTWSFCTSAFLTGSLNAMDTFISQSYGAKNYKLIGLTVQRATLTVTAFSFVVSILWLLTKPILVAIHQDPHVSELASHYVFGLLPGLWFGNILTIIQKYLQGQGIMNPSIVVGILFNILNTIFNFIFVHGLTKGGGLGVIGSSFSTSLAKLISVFLILGWIVYFKLHTQTWFGFSRDSLKWSGIAEYLRLAVPAGLQLSFEALGFEVLTILAGLFGAIPLDAHSVAMNFTLLTFMIPLSISIALSVRIGQLLGSKDPHQPKRVTRIGFCITMGFMVGISLTQFLLRKQIGKIYTKEEEVIELVAKILPVSAVFQFFDGFQTMCQGVIRGTGNQKIGAIANFVAFYIIGVPFSCIFAFGLHKGVIGLWWGLSLGLLTCAVTLGIIVFRINWTKEVDKATSRSEQFVVSGDDVEMGLTTTTESDSVITKNEESAPIGNSIITDSSPSSSTEDNVSLIKNEQKEPQHLQTTSINIYEPQQQDQKTSEGYNRVSGDDPSQFSSSSFENVEIEESDSDHENGAILH